jgi:hypothetical protein
MYVADFPATRKQRQRTVAWPGRLAPDLSLAMYSLGLYQMYEIVVRGSQAVSPTRVRMLKVPKSPEMNNHSPNCTEVRTDWSSNETSVRSVRYHDDRSRELNLCIQFLLHIIYL